LFGGLFSEICVGKSSFSGKTAKTPFSLKIDFHIYLCPRVGMGVSRKDSSFSQGGNIPCRLQL